jgi:hypothetical protein
MQSLLKTLQDASKNPGDFQKQMELLQALNKVGPDFHNLLSIADIGVLSLVLLLAG